MDFFFSALWQKIMALIMSFCMMLGINIPGFAPETDNTQPEVPESAVVISVATDESGKTTQEVALDNGTVIPAGVQVKDGVSELTLTIEEKADSNINIPLEEGETSLSLDVHIEGVSADNNIAILVDLGKILANGMNEGNIALYHEENGVFNQMTQVSSMAKLDAHNEFFYDVVTGNVTIAVATFSNFVFFTDPVKQWEGNFATSFAGGDGTESNPYLIANADQLAYFGKYVTDGNETNDKFFKLTSDINMGGDKVVDTDGKLRFYPIGYNAQGCRYGFEGTFDGAGHKISNIFQNTWQLKGTYTSAGYYKAAMGLFGWVDGATIKNLTVNNFKSEGEYAPTGCVAAYSSNSTFENIAITNSHPQTYNTSVAAVVGRDHCYTDDSTLTFKNITVDSSNTVSALWGSWDVGAAGLLGYLDENTKVTMDNCHIAATIDVYNDVCGNYQYYWYRYCGMLIGTVDKTKADGSLDLSNITATNCTVNFGDRHEYYYCEFVANSIASYTHEHQFSRVKHEDLIFHEDGTVTCTHDHEAAGTEVINGKTVLKEDNQAVYLPFYQLFGGYGWGVDGIDLGEYENIEVGIDASYKKFEKYDESIKVLTSGKTYTLGELFKAAVGARINSEAVIISFMDQYPTNNKTVTMTFSPNKDDWTQGTVTFTGEEVIVISIQDYNLCEPSTMTVEIK